MKKPVTKPTGNQQPSRQPGPTVTQLTTNRALTTQPDLSELNADIDLAALEATIKELPSVNATKLVSLHRRIVNGDYKIQVERIAEKLIALESSLDPR